MPSNGPISVPASGGKPPGKKKRKLLTASDWSIIKRVFSSAHPFRFQIALALIFGIFASSLTAVNMAGMLPVMQLLFEEPGKSRLEKTAEGVKKAEDKLAAAEHSWDKFKYTWDLKRERINYQWKLWFISEGERAIYIMAAILVFAQIVKCFFELMSKYMLQKAFYLAIVRLRTHLYERCLALDLPQFQNRTSGDIIARLNNDIRNVRQVFITMVGDIVMAPFTVLALLVILFLLNWKMTLIVFFGLPLILVPVLLLARNLRSMGRKDEEEDSRILSVIQETIQGLTIVKSFASEKRELKRFRNMSRQLGERQIQREKYRLYGDPVVEIFASVAMAGVLCAGAYVVLESKSAGMSATAFVFYLVMLTRFYPPIKRLTGDFVKLQKALANGDRIFALIDTAPAIVEKPDAIELPPFHDEIVFKDITFHYNTENRPALSNFSLTIPRGKKYALIGETGAGKSTVVRLLPRLYDLESGSITVDGHDIRDLKLKSLRTQIAVVTQEPVLFNDSIFNNIRYARPDAKKNEVYAAARAAYAEEFINELPRGYDTVIGERGGQLSGGQRQRLTIARALLADTPILILDEATSALDNDTESLVQRAIERLMENRTVIVIAHRLSTIRKADEIIVMEDGGIVERGSHDELMKTQGRYYNLLRKPELATA
ncbi:ABC transporter ATP-binding protein [soil metagenome]